MSLPLSHTFPQMCPVIVRDLTPSEMQFLDCNLQNFTVPLHCVCVVGTQLLIRSEAL